MSLKDGQDRKLARRYDFNIARCINALPHYIKWDVKKYGDLREYRPCLISFSVDLFYYRAYKFTLSEFESWSFEDLKITLYKKGIYKLSFKTLNISTFSLSANFKEAMEEWPITLSIGFTKANSCEGSKLIKGSEFKTNDYNAYYYNTGYK